MAAERALSIAEDFTGFGSDITALRKKLRGAGCELFDSFPPYGAWFRRRFGIEHEQALELFHQTVSMKSVGNLTDFVRSHMLEPFDVGSRIEALIRHFDDLDRAHQAVLKAKRQVDLLTPLVEDGARHQALVAEIQGWRDAAISFDRTSPGSRASCWTAASACWRRMLPGSMRRSSAWTRSARPSASKSAVWSGPCETTAATAWRSWRRRFAVWSRTRQQRQKKSDRFQELLARIDEAAPADEAGFLAQQQSIAQRADGLRERIADLDNREREEDFAFRKGREEHTALSDEIDSLQRRKSNIDAAQIRIRDALCAALAIGEDELPFAGELIQVRDDERDWEGAAERLLRGFGLSLLVPDAHYKAVADWVDRQHLGARLVYFHVRPRKAVRRAPALHPQSLVRKLVIKPDSPHYEWLEQELRQRFDVACCDTGEQFRREARAITRAGQIKDPSGRHEKDDRSRIDDRSRYVLGWSNADKLRALRDQRERLEAKLATLGQRIGEIQQARKELRGRLDALSKLEEFTRFARHRLDEPGPPDCCTHRGARAAGSRIRHPARAGAPAQGRAGSAWRAGRQAARRAGQAGRGQEQARGRRRRCGIRPAACGMTRR